MQVFILSLKACVSCGDLRSWPFSYPDTGLCSADYCVDCQSFAVPLNELKAWETVAAYQMTRVRRAGDVVLEE